MVDGDGDSEAALSLVVTANAAVVDARRQVDDARARLVRAVESARQCGASYQAIADALGISRQAAWERFSRT